MNYGKALRKLRTDAGMTQHALAERVSVTAHAVSKWENGVNQPDIAMLQNLCAVFGVSVDEFLLLAKEDGEAAEPVGQEKTAPEASAENAASAEKTAPKENAASAQNTAAAEGAVAAAKKRPRDYPWYFVAGALLLAVLGLILAAALVFGKGRKLSAQQVYEQVNPSVFYIEVQTEKGKQGGSGFFIDKKGTAVTNYHVIKGGLSAGITTADGRQYDVEQVLGASESRDLAVIKIDVPSSRGVSLSYRIRTGETVYTIGYPESFLLGTADSTFTNGIVSKESYYVNGYDYIQTNADMTHGNSGGVLVNERGEVVGITSGQLDVSGVNYMNLAIPSAAIKNVKRNVNMTLKELFSEGLPPEIPVYTVTFYDGARQVETRRVEEGGSLTPPDASYEGYSFGGWFADKELKKPFDFSAPVTENTSVYGDFTPITYYVSYDAQGGAGTMERRAVTYGETFTVENCGFTYPRWSFENWSAEIGGETRLFSAGESVSNLTVKDGDEIVFNAVWVPWKYTISYNVAGGDAQTSDIVSIGKSLKLPLPTRYGYSFAHWTYNGETFEAGQSVCDLDPTFTIPVITMTAEWTPITFTARYHLNNNEYVENQTVDRTVTFGDSAPSGDDLFECTGFKFCRWEYRVSDSLISYLYAGYPNEATGTQGAVVEFYAYWDPIEFIVEYDCDGDGTMGGKEDFELKSLYTESVWVYNSYAGEREGMAVDHWIFKSSDGQEREFKSGDEISFAESQAGARCRFTAVWRPLRYRVQYVIPDGESIIDTVIWGEKYLIRGADTVNRTGYTILSWHEFGEDFIYGLGQEVENLCSKDDASFLLYGTWRAHTYTVQFSAPDADSGEMADMTFTYGEAQPLALNAFVREGYYLAGWQLNEQVFFNGESVKNLAFEDGGSVTLIAVWEKGLDGAGTKESPYLISDLDELNKVNAYVRYVGGGEAAHYALTADIDAENAAFAPIGRAVTDSESGSSPVTFSGTFDGGGHIIKNIMLADTLSNNGAYCYAGLFASLGGATVKNLGIENYAVDLSETASSGYFQFRYYVGALAGTVSGASRIENVFADGSITVVGGSEPVCVGGLVGQFAGTMSNCYALGTISVSAAGGSTGGALTTNALYVGGIAGLAAASDETVFEYCYADVDISGALTGSSTRINDYLGGFLGFARNDGNVSFRFCFSFGDLRYARASAAGFGRFAGSAENARFRSVYLNADARLWLNNINQVTKEEGVTEAYKDELSDFGWIKEHLGFSEEIWSANEGGLPVLTVFGEGRV